MLLDDVGWCVMAKGLMFDVEAVTVAVFSEVEGNSLLAGLEKAGASLRPEGYEGEVRLRVEQDSGGNTVTRREKVNM